MTTGNFTGNFNINGMFRTNTINSSFLINNNTINKYVSNGKIKFLKILTHATKWAKEYQDAVDNFVRDPTLDTLDRFRVTRSELKRKIHKKKYVIKDIKDQALKKVREKELNILQSGLNYNPSKLTNKDLKNRLPNVNNIIRDTKSLIETYEKSGRNKNILSKMSQRKRHTKRMVKKYEHIEPIRYAYMRSLKLLMKTLDENNTQGIESMYSHGS